MARQATGKLQKIPEERLTITGKIRKINAGCRATNRGRQGNRQSFQKVMPPRIPAPRISHILKTSYKPPHSDLSTSRSQTRINLKPRRKSQKNS
jgi:hypothetical protein